MFVHASSARHHIAAILFFGNHSGKHAWQCVTKGLGHSRCRWNHDRLARLSRPAPSVRGSLIRRAIVLFIEQFARDTIVRIVQISNDFIHIGRARLIDRPLATITKQIQHKRFGAGKSAGTTRSGQW